MTIEEKKAYMHQWYLDNKAHINRYKKKHPYHHKYNQKKYKQMLKWRKRNREKWLEYQRQYQKKYIKKYRKQFFADNPGKEEEYKAKALLAQRTYFRKNKKKIYAQQAVYRALKRAKRMLND